ncbi:MAG: hypothetical protein ACXW3K_06070 [Brevundimonas sp.]
MKNAVMAASPKFERAATTDSADGGFTRHPPLGHAGQQGQLDH